MRKLRLLYSIYKWIDLSEILIIYELITCEGAKCKKKIFFFPTNSIFKLMFGASVSVALINLLIE